MDDDDDFDDFGEVAFDESTLRQLDDIESRAASKPPVTKPTSVAQQSAPRDSTRSAAGIAGSSTGSETLARRDTADRRANPISSDAIDLIEDWDDDGLSSQPERAERRAANTAPSSTRENTSSYFSSFKWPTSQSKGSASSSKSASKPTTQAFNRRSPQKARQNENSLAASVAYARQLTLFGDVAPLQPTQGVLIQAKKANSAFAPASQPDATQNVASTSAWSIAGPSNAPRPNAPTAKTKQWDYAQPLIRPKALLKPDPDDLDGYIDEDDDFNFRDVPPTPEFELAPPPVKEQIEILQKMKVQIDREAARTWIYPTNKEKRDYQFNIVQRALFNNVLVALPTGLGKTFIAAVVILNYFRWFPTGKIIFVAPTKPLVAQQQVACHGICGLPWDTAIEMTGETRASLRAEEWKSKRIFYMTPQTFENDLCSTAIDAEDVVCVVVDEAHRATGNYAYAKVVRHLMTRNPFFRVLALTATPGSNSDKVQEVVDSLHINLIEIRQEDALDIRQYVHAKEEDPVVVPLTGVVLELRDLLGKLMRPHMDILIGAGLLPNREPPSIAPFAVQSIYKDPRKKAVVAQRKLYNHISSLASLARAMEALVKYSVSMFASRMLDLETGSDSSGRKSSTVKQQSKFQVNSIAREIRRRYEEIQDAEGFVPHPKMDYLQNVIAAHFAQYDDPSNGTHGAQDTRVMVFCSLRECVEEIVTLLNRVPSVKATHFVGQSADRKGNRGLRQREQEQIVADFKKGDFNVLVATSIGEEGLDIGEVDLIVCYEAVKNAVRMLQRVGRTGRKRDGRIVVLMSEGPEENNWQQSKDNYKTIQHDIIKGINLELFDDVDRLVPPDITSEVRFEEVDQPPFEPSMIRDARKRRKGAASASGKRKRNSDPMRNVPEGASSGFVKVSDMRKGRKASGSTSKAATKKKAKQANLREGDSESSDGEIRQSSNIQELLLNMGNSRREDDLASDEDDGFVGGLGSILPRSGSPGNSNGAAKTASTSTSSKPIPRGRSLGTGRPKTQSSKEPSSEDTPLMRGIANASGKGIARSPLIARSPSGDNVIPDELVGSPDSDTSSLPILKRRQAAPHPLWAQLSDVSSDEDELDDNSVNKDSSPAKRKRTSLQRKMILDTSSPVLETMGPPILPAQRKSSAKTDRSNGRTAGPKKEISSKARKKRIGGSPSSRKLFNVEADRSTDEEIHGELDEHDEGMSRYDEDSSDREHVGDFAPTQAPKGYRQQAIYMQSLHTQTEPSPFRRQKAASGHGTRPLSETPSRSGVTMLTDSTPARPGGSDDSVFNEYEKGSFVCSDEDIAYATDAEGSSVLNSSQW